MYNTGQRNSQILTHTEKNIMGISENLVEINN